MNPLDPNRMTPPERRAALCRILALGLVRLRMRDTSQIPDKVGEFPLHNSADQSGHATPTHEETT
jgi:hypothetical protein